MSKKIEEFGIIRKSLFIFSICLITCGLPMTFVISIMVVVGIIGILMLVFGIIILVRLFSKTKKTISPELYEKKYLIRIIHCMLENENKLLDAYTPKKSKQYETIKKVFDELGPLMTKYGLAVLETPIELTKPMSAHAAAILGNAIGGPVLGVVYAQEANTKMEEYKKSKDDALSSKVLVGSLEEKVMDAYHILDDLFMQCEKTNKIMTNIKESEDKKIKEEYTITSLWYYW